MGGGPVGDPDMANVNHWSVGGILFLLIAGSQVDEQPTKMELMTVNEVATMLRISKRTVSELITERTRSGELRGHPLPVVRIGRSVRFKKSDVEAWVEKLAAPRLP
jgi:excisionase family DNA binding protein